MEFPPGDPPEGDPNPDSPVEWEDNWLSNFFAAASKEFTPAWCQTPSHWTSKLTQYCFTDCPCCLFFRGLILGLVFSIPIWSLVIGLIYWVS